MEVRTYTVVFENAGPDGWGAYVPDMPGCTAGGKTFEAAKTAIRKSIELWIATAKEDGQPIPAPTAEAVTLSVAV